MFALIGKAWHFNQGRGSILTKRGQEKSTANRGKSDKNKGTWPQISQIFDSLQTTDFQRGMDYFPPQASPTPIHLRLISQQHVQAQSITLVQQFTPPQPFPPSLSGRAWTHNSTRVERVQGARWLLCQLPHAFHGFLLKGGGPGTRKLRMRFGHTANNFPSLEGYDVQYTRSIA